MALLTDCLHWESSSFCDLPAVARLEHGIWGDGQPIRAGKPNPNYTWKEFEPLLKKQGYETIIVVDYSGENANSFNDPNIRKKIRIAIDDALDTIGASNLAGRKVDIVAHSMGGLVVRSFCEKEKDFCKESIRKLITIDTPHEGSELADLLLIYRDQNEKFKNPFSFSSPIPSSCHFRVNGFIKDHPIDFGGVDSLAVGKVPSGIEEGAKVPPIGKWSGLPWPDSPTIVYSIIGKATGYQDKAIKKLWNWVLTPCGFERESVFSGGGGDDGIVGANSQIGGIGGQNFDEDHFSVLGDEKVVEKIKEFLNK